MDGSLNAAEVATSGYVAKGPGSPLELQMLDLGQLGAGEILIKVSHCGVCASDLALMDNAFGAGGYPMVLGHEISGIVEAVGTEVVGIGIGDRVGVGPLKDSCGHCRQCENGREMHCPDVRLVAEPHGMGGFAGRLKISARFAFAIPDEISSEHAAALMCAGLTTFAPLRRLARTGDRVGVLGIGGLGHLAVKFACAMGCAVTTFSASVDHAELSRRRALGADRNVDVDDLDSLRAATGSIDLLISTASGKVPWRRLMHSLAPEGQICMLGGSLEHLDIVPLNLIHHQRGLSGSAAGSRRDMREMLAFAATHDIRPIIEVLPMDQINVAVTRLRSADVRYRFVLAAPGEPEKVL